MFITIQAFEEIFGKVQRVFVNDTCYEFGTAKYNEAIKKVKTSDVRFFLLSRIDGIVTVRLRIFANDAP